MRIEIKKLNDLAKLPVYSSKEAAGGDLCSAESEPMTIKPGETKFIGTGLAMRIPQGYVGLVFARSGLACKSGLAPANKVGVIDSDYRGEIKVALHNHSQNEFTVNPGDRIAQIVIVPFVMGEFEVVDELENSERGAGGFGSTGKS